MDKVSSEVLSQLSTMVAGWQLFLDQQIDWSSGPAANLSTGETGERPMVDSAGNSRQVKTPAELEQQVTTQVARLKSVMDSIVHGESNANIATDAMKSALLSSKKSKASEDHSALMQASIQKSEGTVKSCLEQAIENCNSSKQNADSAKKSEQNVEASKSAVLNAETNVVNTQRSVEAANNSAITAAKEAKNSESISLSAKQTCLDIKASVGKSETNVISQEIAAKQSATDASVSQKSASVSMNEASKSQSSAKASETNSKQSEVNSKLSETNAKKSELNSASSASIALSSKTQAKTSETNSKASEVACKTYESSSKDSKIQSKKSCDIAITCKDTASAASNSAKTSEVEVKKSEAIVAAYQKSVSDNASAAANSKTAAAAASASAKSDSLASKKNNDDSLFNANESKKYAQICVTNKTTAVESAITAKRCSQDTLTNSTIAQKARDDAQKARDDAQKAASSVMGSITDMGGWDASSGKYPEPFAVGSVRKSSIWRVTKAGVVSGVQFSKNDILQYTAVNNSYFIIDNTDAVSLVNGKSGVVTLTAKDVNALGLDGGKLAGALSIKNTLLDGMDDKTLKVSNQYGHVEIGPKDANYAHIYTDRPMFYLNKDLKVNGRKVYHEGFRPTAADIGSIASFGVWSSSGTSILNNKKSVLNCSSDKIIIGGDFKDLLFSDNKIYHQGFKPTAKDVNAFKSDGIVGTFNDTAGVPWRSDSGVYQENYIGASRLVVNFKGSSSTTSFQIRAGYANGGLWYRSSRDDKGFEKSWAKIYTDQSKPTPADIGALSEKATAINSSRLDNATKEQVISEARSGLVTTAAANASYLNKSSFITQESILTSATNVIGLSKIKSLFIVAINGVIQSPKSYSLTGSSITFGDTLLINDEVLIIGF